MLSRSLCALTLALLVILFDCETGFYRIQSSFWRTINANTKISVNENRLKKLLERNLNRAADIASRFKQVLFEGALGDEDRAQYPLIALPALYLYPQDEGFYPAYYAVAYQPVQRKNASGKRTIAIEQVQVIVNAATGKRVWQAIGRSHRTEDFVNYHHRIEAVNYALSHDDGVSKRELTEADIILVGVSRCGKTPTCLYLAMQFGIAPPTTR